MKDYINLFHGIISEIHFWDGMKSDKKKDCLSNFLKNFENTQHLVDYFDSFSRMILKKII